MKKVNRINIVLEENKRTAKWLVEQIGKNPTIVSKWCTNTVQTNMGASLDIANS